VNDILILIIASILAVILGAWAASKQLEKSLYETFKQIGIKALSIIGIINIFTIGSEQLFEDEDSSDEQETN
jgi:uncharacterized membrane protein